MIQFRTCELSSGSKNTAIIANAIVSDCIADISSAAVSKNAYGVARNGAAKVIATAKWVALMPTRSPAR